MLLNAQQALQLAANACERMRPHGGRQLSEEQLAAFNALTAAAEEIRKIKDQLKLIEGLIGE